MGFMHGYTFGTGIMLGYGSILTPSIIIQNLEMYGRFEIWFLMLLFKVYECIFPMTCNESFGIYHWKLSIYNAFVLHVKKPYNFYALPGY